MVLVAGCTFTTDGNPVSIYADPFTVGGLPAKGGPSGPRDGVPDSDIVAENGDRGDIDRLAINAVDDIQAFWRAEYPKHFKGDFAPVDKLVSWDAKTPKARAIQFCTFNTSGVANAAYCVKDNTIGWDRRLLLPAMIDAFGPMAVVMVLAHEYGHAIQHHSGIVGDDDPGIVLEQQADCFSGAFMRYVVEGKSKHFTLNTADGLNSVLAAAVSIRDSNPNDPKAIHGSAFERVTAVQIGFTDGPAGCVKIDEQEVESRRGDLPQRFSSAEETGELPVTEQSLTELSKALETEFPIKDKPRVTYGGYDLQCKDGRATEPVSYCPATNTIGADVPSLAERGTPQEDDGGIQMTVTGDYGAYVVFASRYMLALQKSRGQNLTEAKAGLRAACLSGVLTAKLSEDGRDPARGDITLSPGDLDEAVSGLLTDGLVASNVNGETVPSGFSRVDAFRSGVLGGESRCAANYT